MSEPVEQVQESCCISDADTLPVRPILQALASKNSWVHIVFYSNQPPTVAELDRTIELLCMIRNGWS